MRKPIVIIGGMGPQASLRLHELLIQKSKQYHGGNNNDYPAIVHFSVPVPDFIGSEQQKSMAVAMLRALSPQVTALDASCILLACNTAHLIAGKVDYLHSPVFTSMITSVTAAIKRDGVQQIGLLASPTTIRSRLYSDALGKLRITTLTPEPSDLQEVEKAIRAVLAGDNTPTTQLAAVGTALQKRKADALLLGCTELPLVFPKNKMTIPVYDCLDIYANDAINRYYLYNGA